MSSVMCILHKIYKTYKKFTKHLMTIVIVFERFFNPLFMHLNL